jgi:hypothetical protein
LVPMKRGQTAPSAVIEEFWFGPAPVIRSGLAS